MYIDIYKHTLTHIVYMYIYVCNIYIFPLNDVGKIFGLFYALAAGS